MAQFCLMRIDDIMSEMSYERVCAVGALSVAEIQPRRFASWSHSVPHERTLPVAVPGVGCHR